MKLTNKEDKFLSNVLPKLFETSKKCPVGDLDLGSLIVVRCIEQLDNEDAASYALLVTFRKNKEDTRCASFEGFDSIDVNYVLQNNEEVVPLMSWKVTSNDTKTYLENEVK